MILLFWTDGPPVAYLPGEPGPDSTRSDGPKRTVSIWLPGRSATLVLALAGPAGSRSRERED